MAGLTTLPQFRNRYETRRLLPAVCDHPQKGGQGFERNHAQPHRQGISLVSRFPLRYRRFEQLRWSFGNQGNGGEIPCHSTQRHPYYARQRFNKFVSFR